MRADYTEPIECFGGLCMFIGREKELQALERLYGSDRFEFVVLYGRRRVGKTALISRFIADKRAVYCMGVESNAKQNLENLTRSILELSAGERINATFDSFQDALEHVFRLAENERIVLAIDEYPYLARGTKSLASTLQMLIDRHHNSTRLMLILCGSSVSYMEDHVLAYKAPLYGRRTAQIRLEPFDFEQVCRYLSPLSAMDKALLYGVVGGTPQYLREMRSDLTAEQNIRRTFLDSTSALFEEPSNLLRQEVREAAVYNAIITAIASGSSKMSEIATKVGESTSACSAYLRTLRMLGLVQKEAPYGEKASKKAIYALEDNMFRFWYRFIPENMSLIARGAQDLAWQRIEPHLPRYMGKVFEQICRQYLWRCLLAGQSPVLFSSLGRWWGNDPTRKAQMEIDILGAQDEDTALFGECKWTQQPVDVEVLETLRHRAGLFPYRERHLYLFAKEGFTPRCEQAAREDPHVHLLSFSQMMTALDA